MKTFLRGPELQTPHQKNMVIVAMGERLVWKLLWKRGCIKEIH